MKERKGHAWRVGFVEKVHLHRPAIAGYGLSRSRAGCGCGGGRLLDNARCWPTSPRPGLAARHDRYSFAADEVAVAAIRFVERISEASRRLDPTVKLQEPKIPWSDIAGIGNVLRHNYDRVDPIVLWNILTVDLPELADAIQRLLAGDQRPA